MARILNWVICFLLLNLFSFQFVFATILGLAAAKPGFLEYASPLAYSAPIAAAVAAPAIAAPAIAAPAIAAPVAYSSYSAPLAYSGYAAPSLYSGFADYGLGYGYGYDYGYPSYYWKKR